MDVKAIVAALLSGVLCCASCAPARRAASSFDAAAAAPAAAVPSSAPAPKPLDPQAPSLIDFNVQIRPILEARCQPCHFEGGKMYARLPFDRPGTIRDLGTRLFSRLKDEQDQALVRMFLAQPAAADEGTVCRPPQDTGSDS